MCVAGGREAIILINYTILQLLLCFSSFEGGCPIFCFGLILSASSGFQAGEKIVAGVGSLFESPGMLHALGEIIKR